MTGDLAVLGVLGPTGRILIDGRLDAGIIIGERMRTLSLVRILNGASQ